MWVTEQYVFAFVNQDQVLRLVLEIKPVVIHDFVTYLGKLPVIRELLLLSCFIQNV